jgi:hypothetical protein
MSTLTVVVEGNTVVRVPRAKREKRDVETREFGAFARRIVRAYGRRVADRDIEALAELVALRDAVDAAIHDAATALHGEPYSWTDIGRVLGITRQAAQMRLGKPRTTTTKETRHA